MEKLHKWVALTLILTFMTTSIYGQSLEYQNDEDYGSAYTESSHSAHWSAYVPIGVMVVAAIWFGIADQKHNNISKKSPSSGYQSHYSSYNSH